MQSCVLQAPDPKECAAAWLMVEKSQRYDPYRQVRNVMHQHGYPKCVVVGASHVMHWACYAKGLHTIHQDKDILANFRFVGVGGTKLESMVDYIRGRYLPKKKQYLKNQWAKLINSNFDADHIIVVVGSNSVINDFDKSMKRIYRHGPDIQVIQRRMQCEFKRVLKEMQRQQHRLVKFSQRGFENAQI